MENNDDSGPLNSLEAIGELITGSLKSTKEDTRPTDEFLADAKAAKHSEAPTIEEVIDLCRDPREPAQFTDPRPTLKLGDDATAIEGTIAEIGAEIEADIEANIEITTLDGPERRPSENVVESDTEIRSPASVPSTVDPFRRSTDPRIPRPKKNDEPQANDEAQSEAFEPSLSKTVIIESRDDVDDFVSPQDFSSLKTHPTPLVYTPITKESANTDAGNNPSTLLRVFRPRNVILATLCLTVAMVGLSYFSTLRELSSRAHEAQREHARQLSAHKKDTGAQSAAAAPGILNLRCTPRAHVYLDGLRVGMTPLLNIGVSPGRHELLLKSVKLDISRNMKIRIRPGLPLDMNVNMTK